VLEAAGFKVLLADAKHMAGVAARDKKSDPTDCEWIQRLHSVGMLKGAFRPAEQVCMLRTLVRDKGTLVAEAGDWIRRMQKSLDPGKLAKLRDRHCRKRETEIAEQLTGHWREDHLFSLSRGLEMYDQTQRQIETYEREIRRSWRMRGADERVRSGPATGERAEAAEDPAAGAGAGASGLYGISGSDLASIDGIGVETALTLVSEHGVALNRGCF